MFVRYTVEAGRVMAAARKLSSEYGHNYVGVAHLAVALLSSRRTEAVAALKRLRVPRLELRDALIQALPPRSTAGDVNRPMPPRLKQVLQRASKLARARDSGPIGTDDLLMALLQVEGPTREQIAAVIIGAVNGSAYSFCVAADILRTVGYVFRDLESYPRAPKTDIQGTAD